MLDSEIAEMVMPFLGPSRVQTGYDAGEECFTVERGVVQGSPLSPTLCNMFMDIFPESLPSVPKKPAKMFADDLKLSAVNSKGLQRLLYPATKTL